MEYACTYTLYLPACSWNKIICSSVCLFKENICHNGHIPVHPDMSVTVKQLVYSITTTWYNQICQILVLLAHDYHHHPFLPYLGYDFQLFCFYRCLYYIHDFGACKKVYSSTLHTLLITYSSNAFASSSRKNSLLMQLYVLESFERAVLVKFPIFAI